jgi:hypothetical protein
LTQRPWSPPPSERPPAQGLPLSPSSLPPKGFGHISRRRPPEPILIPRLRIEFADFPDTTLFYELKAAHLGALMRLSVRSPISPAALANPAAFQGPREPTQTGRKTPRSPRAGSLTPAERSVRGCAGPRMWRRENSPRVALGCHRGARWVAPVAVNRRRGNINPLPFRPSGKAQVPPSAPPGLRLGGPRGGGVRLS